MSDTSIRYDRGLCAVAETSEGRSGVLCFISKSSHGECSVCRVGDGRRAERLAGRGDVADVRQTRGLDMLLQSRVNGVVVILAHSLETCGSFAPSICGDILYGWSVKVSDNIAIGHTVTEAHPDFHLQPLP